MTITRSSRRAVLRWGLLGTMGSIGAGSAAGRLQSQDPSVSFEAQQSNGSRIVVEEVVTDRSAILMIFDQSGERIDQGNHQYEAGDRASRVDVLLSPPIQESQQLTARLVERNGSQIAMDRAFVAVGDDADLVEGMETKRVDPSDGDAFNYPYFLFAPSSDTTDPVPILVEPNNTGTSTDDFPTHREEARETIERGTGRTVCGRLGVPLLVPVFPRPRSDPVDSDHYTHQLDRDTLAIEDGPLERIDLQLLAMVEDARSILESETDYSVGETIALNGFSASGNFVDRFAVLHADRVQSVTAGGLNGMALLPQAERDGHELRYHVGIADVEGLTGESADLEALDGVDQFLYMGEDDTNDTIPYDGPWTDPQLRDTALEVYGEHMITDRFPTCQAAYQDAGVSAQFRVYRGVGHSPHAAIDDIVAFHQASMNGEPVEDFGQDLSELSLDPDGGDDSASGGSDGGGDPSDSTATFELAETNATVGQRITFDASGSEGAHDLTYIWSFGDGATASSTGDSIEYIYGDPGEYTVELELRDGSTIVASAERTITVHPDPSEDQGQANDTVDEPPEDATGGNASGPDTDDTQTEAVDGEPDAPTNASTPNATRTDEREATGNRSNESAETTDDSEGTPGFEVGTAIAGLLAGVGVLRSRLGGKMESGGESDGQRP